MAFSWRDSTGLKDLIKFKWKLINQKLPVKTFWRVRTWKTLSYAFDSEALINKAILVVLKSFRRYTERLQSVKRSTGGADRRTFLKPQRFWTGLTSKLVSWTATWLAALINKQSKIEKPANNRARILRTSRWGVHQKSNHSISKNSQFEKG